VAPQVEEAIVDPDPIDPQEALPEAGDLAVQEAVKIGLGLKTRPTAKQMIPLAEPWRPMRGAAAHLWWSYYRAIKKREGVISGTTKANAVSNKVPVAKRS